MTHKDEATPGPWRVEMREDYPDAFTIWADRDWRNPGATFIVEKRGRIFGAPGSRDPLTAEQVANARLIAAAPALRDALRRIARSEPRPKRNGDYDASDIQSLQRTARAALALLEP